MRTPLLTFDSKGASGHMPGGIATKNPCVAAAKSVMSKMEPEQEARKVASDRERDRKIHGHSRNPGAEVGGLKVGQ